MGKEKIDSFCPQDRYDHYVHALVVLAVCTTAPRIAGIPMSSAAGRSVSVFGRGGP